MDPRVFQQLPTVLEHIEQAAIRIEHIEAMAETLTCPRCEEHHQAHHREEADSRDQPTSK